MRKNIVTKTGAKYSVTTDGTVTRERGGTDIIFTTDGYQYTNGHLVDDYDDVVKGVAFLWYGVVNNKAAELIQTSVVVSVEEQLV